MVDYPTTIHHVAEMHPRVLRRMDQDDYDGHELLRAAWRQMVLPELRSRRLDVSRILDAEQLIPYHVACCGELLAREEMEDGGRVEVWEHAQNERARIGDLLFANLTWYDESQDLIDDGQGESQLAVTRRLLR